MGFLATRDSRFIARGTKLPRHSSIQFLNERNCIALSNRVSVTPLRVYYRYSPIGYQLAMSTLSEESRQIVASLAHRVGPNADIAKTAHAIVSILQDIEATLTPVIGQQGVVALYRRSLHLCGSAHPRLTSTCNKVPSGMVLTALNSVLVEQSEADARFFGEMLLTTFYELLTTLIGPSLTARLLRDVWDSSLSDTPSQENSP